MNNKQKVVTLKSNRLFYVELNLQIVSTKSKTQKMKIRI